MLLKCTKRMICVGVLLAALLSLTGAGLANTPVNHVPKIAATDGWVVVSTGTTENLNGIDFIDAQNGWVVGRYGAIYQSTDGGLTWANKSITGQITDLQSVDFLNSTYGMIGGSSLILKTTNGGTSWTDITPVLFSNTPYKIQILNATHAWIQGNPFSNYIYYTTNGGSSWTSVVISIDMGIYDGMDFVNFTHGWVVGDDGSSHGRVLFTVNAGATWTTINVPASSVYTVKFVTANIGFIYGNRASDGANTLWKSTDGGATWNEAVGEMFFYGDHFSFINETYGWGIGVEIGRTTNGGTSWIEQNQPPDTYMMSGISSFDANRAWICCSYGKVLYTTSGGVSTPSPPPPPGGIAGYDLPVMLAGAAIGGVLVCATIRKRLRK